MKGLKKYKTFEEAERDQWVFEPDENYFKIALSRLSMEPLIKIGGRIKRGLYKYKRFEDAQKDELKWLLQD